MLESIDFLDASLWTLAGAWWIFMMCVLPAWVRGESAWPLTFGYVSQVFIAVDQLINALIPPLTGTLSYADETLSARLYRTHRDGKFWGFLMHPANALFVWQEWDMNHCQRAWRKEGERAGLPYEYRAWGDHE